MSFDKFNVIFEKNKNFTNDGSFGIPEFTENKNEALRHFGKENIQNSLDARSSLTSNQDSSDTNSPHKPKPIKLHFKYMSNSDLSDDACKELNRLRKKLIDAGNPATIRSPLEDQELKPSCLIIHEEGTTGLTGDYDKKSFEAMIEALEQDQSGGRKLTDDEKKKLDRQNFLSLTRTTGVSYKQDDKLGSRGVGKWTLCYASKIRTFLFITKRETDSKTLIGGVTRLSNPFSKPNSSEGQYLPLGTWGQYDSDGWGADGSTPMSDEKNKEFIENYQKLFNIDRSKSGTTFIIPFIDDEYDDVRKTLYMNIEAFYRSFLREDIILSHEGCYDGKKSGDKNKLELTKYDSQNLGDFLENVLSNNTISHFFDFDKKHQKNLKNPDFTLKTTACDNEILNREDFEEGDFDAFIDAFKSGEVVTIKVPVSVPLKNGDTESEYFVSIKKADELGSILGKWKRVFRDVYHVSNALDFTNPIKISKTEKHFCIVEAIKNTPMYTMLRASEGESHQRLQEDNVKLALNYHHKKTRPIIRAFIRSYTSLVAMLKSEIKKQANISIGLRYLKLKSDESMIKKGKEGGKSGQQGKTTKKKKKKEIFGLPYLLDTRKNSNRDGFSWHINKEIPNYNQYFTTPIEWRIDFQAVNRLGKPDKLVSKCIDIRDASKFQFTLNGVKEFRVRERNTIYVRADNPDFIFKLKYNLPSFLQKIVTRYKQERMK